MVWVLLQSLWRRPQHHSSSLWPTLQKSPQPVIIIGSKIEEAQPNYNLVSSNTWNVVIQQFISMRLSSKQELLTPICGLTWKVERNLDIWSLCRSVVHVASMNCRGLWICFKAILICKTACFSLFHGCASSVAPVGQKQRQTFFDYIEFPAH